MIHESNVTFLNRARLERQENGKKKTFIYSNIPKSLFVWNA